MTAAGPPAVEPDAVDLSVRLAGLDLPNPVMTAAGCAGAGRELAPFLDLAGLGAIVTRSVTRDPRPGMPTPRTAETPSGLLSATGMPGPGADVFLATELPWLVHAGARPVVSIAVRSDEEAAELARRVGQAPGVAAIEVNLAWPDERAGSAAAKLVGSVRAHLPADLPLVAKLGPAGNPVETARAVIDSGADGVCLISPLPALAIDRHTLRPRLSAVTGGLSGPAVHAVAVRTVWDVHRALPHVPIVGVGGIARGFDALEMVLAGASAVQVGTAAFHDPAAPARVLAELAAELAGRGLLRLDDLIGAAHA